jgi:two-component system nitrogen regulation response regulator NtrX
MGDRIKILVVEDENEACKYMASYLRHKGFDALVANSAEEALPIIKEQNPDIVFLDIYLPGMSGTDLLRLVRQFNTKTKVVTMSGYPVNFQNDQQTKKLNISGFIEKPLFFNTLDSVLEKIIKEVLYDN